ncbi:hypothetical protein P7K49_020677, partial [Saguinus oedipus]
DERCDRRWGGEDTSPDQTGRPTRRARGQPAGTTQERLGPIGAKRTRREGGAGRGGAGRGTQGAGAGPPARI